MHGLLSELLLLSEEILESTDASGKEVTLVVTLDYLVFRGD